MTEEIKNQMKFITKRLDSSAQECFEKNGYSEKTARLRLLAELAREQTEIDEILTIPPIAKV